MVIDSHVHIGRWITPWRSEDATQDLMTTAQEAGIDRLCVFSLGDRGFLAHPTPDELRAANDHNLEAVERSPDALYGLCYVSPEHPDCSLDEIRRCVRDGPLVGIKLWIARKASDPLVDPLLDAAAELGVYVLQHAWYKTTGNLPHESTPADVAEVARRHPGVTIQMAHLNGAGERGIQEVAPYPNVLIDTSGGDPEADLLEYAVQVVGAKRLLFGSDAPGRDFGVQLAQVAGAVLSAQERALILGGNAARLLRLPEGQC